MKLLSSKLMQRIGWATGTYGVVQVLRMGNNIVLAKLLSPELFGIMLIANTLRTGIDLVSDIGVSQNIVSDRDGEQPWFYDTAWTIQVIRGFILAGVYSLIAYPVSLIYHQPLLTSILPVFAILLFFSGFDSTSKSLLHKRMQVLAFGVYEIATTAFSVVAYIAFALITPTVWALVLGNVVSGAALLVGSFLLIPGLRHRIMIDRTAATRMLRFGRWVFLSTLVYFLAMNFDRLYLAKALPLAVLGTYGIARSLSDVLNQLVMRVGHMVVFPMVASSHGEGVAALRRRLERTRPRLLLAVALGVSAFVASSDLVVKLLYDARYQEAAVMLPILALGIWFAVLSTLNEAILLGIGRPVYSAAANGTKLVWLVIGLPIAVRLHGIIGAVCVAAAAEAIRYVPLWLAQKREHLSFGREDAMLTLFTIAMIVAWRWLFETVGLTGGFAALFPGAS